MNNPCYFTVETFKIGFKNIPHSPNNNHANSILSIIQIYTDFIIETRYFIKMLKEIVIFYARLINQY